MPGPESTIGKATTKPSFSLATNHNESATPHLCVPQSGVSSACSVHARRHMT
jgi:hypothetical protein